MWIDVNDSYGQADKWWLRSPRTTNNFDTSACRVGFFGDVDHDYVGDSYGIKKTPSTSSTMY